ncbi:MAG: peptidoglycan DD-metalloendopeptidase family protein [Parashewanella sp.]
MLRVVTLFKLLPVVHKVILSLLLGFFLILFLLPSDQAQASKQTKSYDTNTRYTIPLAFRKPEPPTRPIISKPKQQVSNTPKKQLVEQIVEQPLASQHFKVRSGDTLARLFQRIGLTAKDVYEISRLPLAKKNLLTLMPGEELAISKTHDGKFAKLQYNIDEITTLHIDKNADRYQEKLTKKQVQTRTQFATADIKSNFWNAAIDAGLKPNQIMALATLFGWDIDFALDLREGDRFSLIFEQEYANGEFLRNGNILAAEFFNQGERFTAIRYTNGQYYSETGRSMRKAFLRSPVDFTRVSSNFNPRRLHPVTGRIKAHRGVDYVAPVGTPIKSAGRGKVIAASYNKFNGNYVFIKHNDTYTTKYLHLKKRKVRRGQTVKQGQIIGTLGSTGRVTGAHLHYEFIVNGVHRNPRTVKLPKSNSIARKEKAQFLAHSKTLMAQLEHNKSVYLAGTP